MSINQLTATWAEKNNITTFFENTVDSTNTWAKKQFQSDFAVYLADHQTQGRGRHQNTWTDLGVGSTLLSTWCLKASSAPQPVFPLRVGLSLYEAFQSAWPSRSLALKAPNDIYLIHNHGAGKLAGILTEVEQFGSEFKIFIGIGANVYKNPENVGQATASLGDVQDEDWFKFCYRLWQNFVGLSKDPQRQRLTPEEQSLLLLALQKYPDNAITHVNADGSLALSNGRELHWQDL